MRDCLGLQQEHVAIPSSVKELQYPRSINLPVRAMNPGVGLEQTQHEDFSVLSNRHLLSSLQCTEQTLCSSRL